MKRQRDGHLITPGQFFNSDPDDVYSHNLAKDFERHFGNGPAVSLSHGSPGTAGQGTARETFHDLAQDVCDRLAAEPATAVVWVGRETDLTAFLREFGKECTRDMTVLGGDTIVSNLGEDVNPLEENSGLTLYYLAHAAPGVIEQPHGLPEIFVEQYEREFSENDATGPRALESGDAALAWDALYVLAEGAMVARE